MQYMLQICEGYQNENSPIEIRCWNFIQQYFYNGFLLTRNLVELNKFFEEVPVLSCQEKHKNFKI